MHSNSNLFGELMPYLIAAVIALAVVGLLLLWWRRPSTYSPRGLFVELCRAHRLSWRDRRLLWALARQQRLAHPAQLFVEPKLFEESTVDPRWQSHRARLNAIRDYLFGNQP